MQEAIALMPKFASPSPVLQNLTFIHEESLRRDGEFGGFDFGGYPTLKQRTYSHTVQQSMNIHCGFVRGTKPGGNTGYDMEEDDLLYTEQCTSVIVASCIFGNFDEINELSNISEYSQKSECFLRFIDEEREKYHRSSGRLDSSKKIGVWRIIVTRNPSYTDGRRTGKVKVYKFGQLHHDSDIDMHKLKSFGSDSPNSYVLPYDLTVVLENYCI